MGVELHGTIIGIKDLGTILLTPARNTNPISTTPFSPPATLSSISTTTPPPVFGIGGLVTEARKGEMCYIFSGPVTCDSSKAAAVAAVSHILGAVIDTNRIDREIQLHLDAKEVVQDMKNIYQGSKLEKEMKEVDGQIKKILRLQIMHIPRESNEGADELAKLGSRRKTW